MSHTTKLRATKSAPVNWRAQVKADELVVAARSKLDGLKLDLDRASADADADADAASDSGISAAEALLASGTIDPDDDLVELRRKVAIHRKAVAIQKSRLELVTNDAAAHVVRKAWKAEYSAVAGRVESAARELLGALAAESECCTRLPNSGMTLPGGRAAADSLYCLGNSAAPLSQLIVRAEAAKGGDR